MTTDMTHLRVIQTVYSEKCRSWYKLGKSEGRIVGLWPGTHRYAPPYQPSLIAFVGSNLHQIRALEHPRWEDYIYEQADDVANPLYWLGDGQTYNEKTLTGDSECSFIRMMPMRIMCSEYSRPFLRRGMVLERRVH